jgi:hypothetical protein
MEIYNVNAHLHTPYSFSAFGRLTEALDRAVNENVKVVGINDFYSMDGYGEWNEAARERKLFPLFNIEFISLQEEDQAAGIRVNDPNNPGRTYLSGKGLRYPVQLPEPYASALAGVRAEANAQVQQMCGKLNELLAARHAGFTLDFDRIARELTKGAVRERHLAKALRMAVYDHIYDHLNDDRSAIASFFEILFGGKTLQADTDNHAAVENEIRGNLLKAGGAAFIPEDPKAFLPMETVRRIILAAGGIPTYPFLADDAKGEFTDFEQDVAKTAETLKQRGIYSVEFITTRNSVETLEKYAGYLHDNGFVVTFGSEHNTPAMEPIELFARGGTPLTGRLKQINCDGACVIAAHQELVRNGKQGYVDASGQADVAHRDEYIRQGDLLIRAAIG